jgi:adenylate cyclase
MGLHVGIATGPVAAGRIGVTRFIYGLWGDTLNIASHLSCEGTGNAIWLDQATRERLRKGCAFDGPGAVDNKGKGQISLYRVVSRMPVAQAARAAAS